MHYLSEARSSTQSLLSRAVGSALAPLQLELEAVWSYAGTIALWTLKFWALVFVACGWLMGLACSSAITYLLFYNYMIPSYQAALPVHFDVSASSVGLATQQQQSQQQSQPPNVAADLIGATGSGLHAHPHATVQLQGERQWKYEELANLEGVEQTKRFVAVT